MAKRLTLTTDGSFWCFGRRRFSRGDGWTAGSFARLNRALLVINRPPLELVDDLVKRRMERAGAGRTANRPAVDDERDVDDVTRIRTAMALVR